MTVLQSKAISELTSATTLTESDALPIVNDSETKKVLISVLKSYFFSTGITLTIGSSIFGTSADNGTLTLDSTSGNKTSNTGNNNNIIINQSKLDIRGFTSSAIDGSVQSAIIDIHSGIDEGRSIINFYADSTELKRALSIQTHGEYSDYGDGASTDKHVTFYSKGISSDMKAIEWYWGDQWDGILHLPYIKTLEFNRDQGSEDCNIIGSPGSASNLNLYCTSNATVNGYIHLKNRTWQDDIYYASNVFTDKHTMQLINSGVRDANFSILNIVNNVAQTNNSIALSVYSNKIDTNGDLVRIKQDQSTASNTMLSIINAGTGKGLYIDQNGETGTNAALYISNNGNTGRGLYVSTNIDGTASQPLVYIESLTASFDQASLKVSHVGADYAEIFDNDTRYGMWIDQDCTVNNVRTWALDIDSDNAGTGTALGCGIDMSSFSVDEPLIKVPADAAVSMGSQVGQFAIDVGGTTYYVPYYAHA